MTINYSKFRSGRFVLLTALISLFINSNAQNTIDSKFGKGLNVIAKDSSFTMKFSTRIQNRFDGTVLMSERKNDYSDKFYLRRARLKFDGWAHSPAVKYKMEFDVISGQVLDAVVMWNFAGNFDLWVGQTKLPGNRERVISSQKLQFVDRSQLNSKFNIDRDKGIQLRHHMTAGNVVIREMASVSIGEGRNFTGSSEGHDYTGRIEILPFGEFAGKGDYFSSDLKRENSPKLALGVTYDYNDQAVKSGGQLGSNMGESRDLSTVFADLMFKYRGLSIMGEYADKQSDITPVLTDTSGNFNSAFYTGTSINAQMGYLFKNNWEVAARYTQVTPEEVTRNNNITEYTFGVSKYIVGHSLKVQSDVSLHQEATKDDKVIVRMQLELSF